MASCFQEWNAKGQTVAALTAERNELRSEKRREFNSSVARGATTVACCGATVLSAHYYWSIAIMLPALVAAAVNLRHVQRLRLSVFVSFVIALLAAMAGQVYMRSSKRTCCAQPAIVCAPRDHA